MARTRVVCQEIRRVRSKVSVGSGPKTKELGFSYLLAVGSYSEVFCLFVSFFSKDIKAQGGISERRLWHYACNALTGRKIRSIRTS